MKELDPDEMLTSPQVAKLLAITQRTLERMRVAGTGPKFVKMGPRLVRYPRRSLREYYEANQKEKP